MDSSDIRSLSDDVTALLSDLADLADEYDQAPDAADLDDTDERREFAERIETVSDQLADVTERWTPMVRSARRFLAKTAEAIEEANDLAEEA